MTTVQHAMVSQVDQHEIVLVDEEDRPVGTSAKLAAHEHGGRLHRAFSVFIFSPVGQMLLQRRAISKYHFGGLWTNTCCSHPRPGAPVGQAAAERLQYEMGISCPLFHRFSFTYRAQDPASGLTEHEFDHVFTGTFAGDPKPNALEVMEWRWIEPARLSESVAQTPDSYSPWFKIVLSKVLQLPPNSEKATL